MITKGVKAIWPVLRSQHNSPPCFGLMVMSPSRQHSLKGKIAYSVLGEEPVFECAQGHSPNIAQPTDLARSAAKRGYKVEGCPWRPRQRLLQLGKVKVTQ